MFSQDENPVSDASNTRRILTPISDTPLNRSDSLGPGGKKRKRDGNTMEDLLKDSFNVKPYPSRAFAKSRTLQPLLLLPRSNLPLSSLDIGSSSNPLPQSRLFESHVKILELEERMGSQPMTLIARLDDDITLYAVEREDRGLYVLCQLGSWVNLQLLKATAVVSKQGVSKATERNLGPSMDTVSVPLMTAETSKYSKTKRLAIEAIQSMVKRPLTGILTESQTAPRGQESILDSQLEETTLSPRTEEPVAQPTSNEIFETVRNQYFEALYLSKSSLAYFAKGPLSRARAAFHLDYDSTLDMNEYVTFLEGLIMPTTLIDKKYKDGVPGCVSLIDINDHSAEDASHVGKSKKRKSAKKIKPGKAGLYPLEETLIRKWWASYDDDTDDNVPGASREEITRSRISQLRIRETQLQMIVILEVLALHPLACTSADISDGLPTIIPSGPNADGKEKQVKAKKPDHLIMLIDVHIDRLCIWQSIALEAVKTPLDNPPPLAREAGGSSTSLRLADNILRDFCVDIIVPFFSARLPDRCAAINRKLGGPLVVSPPKPKISKSSSFSCTVSRPGAATKRAIPAQPRRSLQRVRTDERERRSESRGPPRPISLMRSMTAPVVLKREASEAPSLSSIPAAESQSLQANRGGVLNSKRFAQREVDMSTLAPDAKTKAKKQVNIEAELKEAISALKKPNRELAGKSLADIAEQRSAVSSHSRKSKKPVRNPLFQGVQISATPKANRKKTVSSASQRSNLPKMSEEKEVIDIPPSSLPRIPQSAAQPSREEQASNPLFPSFQATPTRKSVPTSSRQINGFLGLGPADYGSHLPSSPLQRRRSSVQLFNVVPESAVKIPSSSALTQGVLDTPIKKGTGIARNHSEIACSENEKENMEEPYVEKDGQAKSIGIFQEDSIYKSLGWDDADDIDELA